MERILVVGGAGYIGSHMVRCLQRNDYKVTVLDNLSSGFREAIGNAEFIYGDIGDKTLLDRLFSLYRFDGVMHFASFIQVGESVTNPAKYYDNNIARTITLLNAMVRHNIHYFIFSSTAAVFGNPIYTPIDEAHPTYPINPYGKSKLVIEKILKDYARAYQLQFGVLRYFNAAGADPTGGIGEAHEPETHLIPLVLQVASGRREAINVFGNDYDTEDGTCIRDYIHVSDLSTAHLKLLHYLKTEGEERFFNLGTGYGYTVMEVIRAVEKVTGRRVPVRLEPRRAGDPPILIADGSKARTLLQWQPGYPELETIISHAWQWERELLEREKFHVAA